MKNALFAVIALCIAGCSPDNQKSYTLMSGTYGLSGVDNFVPATDYCGVLATYASAGRQIEIVVDGDPAAYRKSVAFNLDGGTDASNWPTGTFSGSNMGSSTGGSYTTTSGSCLVRTVRQMAADWVGDNELSIGLSVGMYQDPTSPGTCGIADLPPGASRFPCEEGIHFRAKRL